MGADFASEQVMRDADRATGTNLRLYCFCRSAIDGDASPRLSNYLVSLFAGARLVQKSHPSRGSYAFAVNLDLDKDLRPYELIDNQQHELRSHIPKHLRPHLRVDGDVLGAREILRHIHNVSFHAR